jgi:hypothetical protein
MRVTRLLPIVSALLAPGVNALFPASTLAPSDRERLRAGAPTHIIITRGILRFRHRAADRIEG